MNTRPHCGVALLLGLSLAQCSLDAPPEPSIAEMKRDGAPLLFEAAFTTAQIDVTKRELGPNTATFFEARVSSSAARDGPHEWLFLNIPPDVIMGAHEVRFSPLPSRSFLWLQIQRAVQETWTAYAGSVYIDAPVRSGGRLMLHFDELRLSNACGEQSLLQSGRIDVPLGAEASTPVSPVDTTAGSDWAHENGTEQIENNTILQIDDVMFACDLSDLTQMRQPEATAALYVASPCDCGYNPDTATSRDRFLVVGFLPPSGHGAITAASSDFYLSVLYDPEHTPIDISDDDVWMSEQPIHMIYHELGQSRGEPIDIELVRPIRLVHRQRSKGLPSVEPTQTKTLSAMHSYGLLLE